MSQDTVPTTQVHVEEDGHKVFVGNISFQTTEAELAELFSNPTPVLRANIITRGTRSLGYGFVAYETLAQAEEAARTLNKTELDGREINVEVAKPRVERTPSAPRERAPRHPKGENREAVETGDNAEVKPRTGRSSRPRNRKNRNKTRNEGEEGTFEEATPTNGEEKEASTRREGSGRRKRTNRRRRGAPAGEVGADGVAAPARRSAPRQVGPPSKTTVFVANLPFAMEDDGLKELFAEFDVASAHVVRHRDSGRSKGFGFVELVDEDEQQKVLEKMTNVEADGRELVIKIALSEQISTEKEADETNEADDSA